MKRRIAFFVCLLACAAVYAGETSKLLKARLSSGSAAKAGVWLSNFSKAKNYAVDNGLPLIAVWSNGDSCGHCVTFESACNSSYFRKWMASSGMVFYFTHSGESQGAVGGSIFHWCRKNKNTSYPFVRIYWPDGKVDIAPFKYDGRHFKVVKPEEALETMQWWSQNPGKVFRILVEF